MLKILLNSPVNFYTSSELLTVPIGLSYIKSYCEDNFDCEIEIVPVLGKKVLAAKRPDIVGISCFAATYDKAKKVANMAKSMGINVVVGGEQITTCPELLTSDMDVGVRGEGEIVFLELLKTFNDGWDHKTLQSIDGTVFHNGKDELVVNDPVILSKDLDELPMPDLINGNRRTDLLCLMSSRGCPFRCIFCATGWHNNLHWHSPERVIEIIEYHLEKYPNLKRVKFWDDLFTVKFDRVQRIMELIREKGLNKRLKFSVCTRADHINEKLLKLLKRMNCTHVSLGLESGCDKTLKYINKRCTAETNRNAINLLVRHGFNTESSFIVGFPYETKEDIQETYDFIKSIPIDKIQVFLPIPYPGTKLWEYALEKNLVSLDMEWEKLDLIATMADPKAVLTDFVILSEKLSRRELYDWLIRFRRLRKWKTFKFAILTLFKDPGLILQRLRREVEFFARKLSG